MTGYEPIWFKYMKQFFLSSVEDGISYIEARIMFIAECVHFLRRSFVTLKSYRFMYGEDGQLNIPHREWVLLFKRAMEEVKEQLNAEGRGHLFMGAKVRSHTKHKNIRL